jgi:DNA-binding transcriptional MerR regulator
MTTATHAQIVELLGDVDDLFMKRIEDTGASLDEIGEALGDLESEDVRGEPPHAPSSPRVAEVRAILDELLDTNEDDLEQGYRQL